jgi:CheY-like chemotaxis protein/anti-sigma regulatory factor (Ser/Thr protein kinase)
MSHEIRTPMNGIIGFSDLLAGELKGEQKVRIDIIKDCAGSLLNIINDILDFSTIEAGRLGTEIVDCSLRQQLDSVEQLTRPKAEKKAIDFKIITEETLPTAIRTDPTRLRQCLINLTDNAVKFTKQGHVHVTVSQQQMNGKPLIRFDVEDTGIGIPPEKQKMIFEPFTQSDGSTSREFGGTGLGLAITRQLTELLGGDISITSEPGKGSVFTLLLPAGLCQTDQIPADTPDSNECPTQPETPCQDHEPACILVAEDDRNNQKLVALMLDHLRYKRVIVNDGEEAIQAALQQQFDLILMDIQMPVMNGYEATRQLRAKGITVPIVALTARAMASDREKCIAAGCSDYLSKPIDINSLGDIIARNLNPVSAAK